jgi:2-oxo-3-hexenedioate decarboxylase
MSSTSSLPWDVARGADEILACETERRDRPPLTDEWAGMTVEEAYAVQDEVLRRKVASGENVIGVKLGLTSEAKQKRMNVSSPLTGWLTDAMVLAPGQPVPQDQLIHPRAEPEIVFVLKEPLEGPGVTAESALAAVEKVLAGVEIIDSRYRDFRFTLPDVIADNASSAKFVLGSVEVAPDAIDLVNESVELCSDGEVVYKGTGADVQGHPAEALALAANDLATRGLRLEAGWIVLTGGMTDAVFAPTGSQTEARFATLGTVAVHGG